MSEQAAEGPLAAWAFTPRRVDKPWGHELIWALSEQYCGKLLVVRAGHALSLHLEGLRHQSLQLVERKQQLALRGVPVLEADRTTAVVAVGRPDADQFVCENLHAGYACCLPR